MPKTPWTAEQKAAMSAKAKARWAAKKAAKPVATKLEVHPVFNPNNQDFNPLMPPKPSGDVRLYQERPERKEWLTKEQALARGHTWNDFPNRAGKDKSLVRGVPEDGL